MPPRKTDAQKAAQRATRAAAQAERKRLAQEQATKVWPRFGSVGTTDDSIFLTDALGRQPGGRRSNRGRAYDLDDLED